MTDLRVMLRASDQMSSQAEAAEDILQDSKAANLSRRQASRLDEILGDIVSRAEGMPLLVKPWAEVSRSVRPAPGME